MDIKKADLHLIHTYERSVTFARGEGMYLYDDMGKRYLDMGAGIAVSALGYGHPGIVQAIQQQAEKLIHVSNLYYTEPGVKAANALSEASGMDRVFFTNSGTEAVEGALKLARKYVRSKRPESRGEIIAMEHSFHGRSMGALSVTGTEHYRTPFEPLIGGVSFAQYNQLDSVEALVTEDTCAIILETLQGEGGIYPAKQDFMKGLRNLCDEKGILLILDEIQCGMGRTGKMFAYEHYGIKPDIMTSAKALGCGVPIGAFAAREEVAAAMVPGDHGTTYGGNPLATAVTCKVFEIFEEEKILRHVQEMTPCLTAELEKLRDEFDCVQEVRGMGFMQGIQLSVPAADVIGKAREKGLILIAAGADIIRIVPPLIAEKEHIDEMCRILREVLS